MASVPIESAALIKALRRRLGWSQPAMANYLEVDQSNVSKWENNIHPTPRPVRKLLDQLDAETRRDKAARDRIAAQFARHAPRLDTIAAG